jgi:hypothetical protein
MIPKNIKKRRGGSINEKEITSQKGNQKKKGKIINKKNRNSHIKGQ